MPWWPNGPAMSSRAAGRSTSISRCAANSRDGYWPAGALMEGDASTGKWQELTPVLSSSCTVFPRNGFRHRPNKATTPGRCGGYMPCCERRGQVFLGSVDFLRVRR